ncbi:trypsin-like serine peptidase [Kineosporia succinea]|uniref:V8-like Glu-specific endopeptidase n=1 Tax=Kineosporia succinea TaxID=84632 RepID=A0ABT9PEZ9_9ACTN|nr:hypothetical protein [Kineosporia succinea]MDP9830969.1 V8-like Glu-specific endopeptidase [Kineosporia succinea]
MSTSTAARRWVTGAVLVLAAGTLSLSTSTPASAATTEGPVDEVVSAPAPVFPSRAGERRDQAALDRNGGDRRVLDYWTPERMKNATPVRTPRLPAREAARIGRPAADAGPEVVLSEPVSPEPSPTGRAAPPVTNFSPVNGKIFYRNAKDGKDYICSGSAVNSGSKRVVSTAGHCMHAGPGGTWHQNWVFVPGYKNGSRPYGTFSAKTFQTLSDWVTYGVTPRGLNSDVAFVSTYLNAGGQKLVDAVGGHGIVTGGSEYAFDVSIFGYPGNISSGNVMQACYGSTGPRTDSGYTFSTIYGCNFGGGASGGAWLKSYSNAEGWGYLKTITSWGPVGSTAHSNGPFFGGSVNSLFQAVNADN